MLFNAIKSVSIEIIETVAILTAFLAIISNYLLVDLCLRNLYSGISHIYVFGIFIPVFHISTGEKWIFKVLTEIKF